MLTKDNKVAVIGEQKLEVALWRKYKAKIKIKLARSRQKTQLFSYYIIFFLHSKHSGLRP